MILFMDPSGPYAPIYLDVTILTGCIWFHASTTLWVCLCSIDSTATQAVLLSLFVCLFVCLFVVLVVGVCVCVCVCVLCVVCCVFCVLLCFVFCVCVCVVCV